ncbi:hypothetical protein FRC98_12840 [Lujinxingia vulgaris]|uniref:Uncharacterized protein n=1 Tax=Lujinxingia vulgaris TaxID=2600176 RepID=A0A5C6XD50_9DELT|nr:hypothetical protein [Lujinxingia vulgaris]TXD36709.1 hypothetical protein FRC98_12840 [Lujinxingia vulgaris]
MISPNWLVQSSAIGAAGILALGMGMWGTGVWETGASGDREVSPPTSSQVIWVHGERGLRAAGTIRYTEGVARESRIERARRLNAEYREEREARRRAQILTQRAFEASRQAAEEAANADAAVSWAERRAQRQAELAAREVRAQAVRTHLFELYAGPQCVDVMFEPAETPEPHEHTSDPDAFLHPASQEATEVTRQKVEDSLERALEEMQRAFTP